MSAGGASAITAAAKIGPATPRAMDKALGTEVSSAYHASRPTGSCCCCAEALVAAAAPEDNDDDEGDEDEDEDDSESESDDDDDEDGEDADEDVDDAKVRWK